MKRMFLPLALLLVAGCSAFESDYSKLAAEKLEAPQPVAGAWVGRWQSSRGHGGGELRAVIAADSGAAVAANKTYTGRFKAKWGFFTTEYTSAVQTQTDIRKMATVAFHIETNLGFFAGGTYTMDGSSTPTTFVGTYKSNGDEGTIELQRPGQ